MSVPKKSIIEDILEKPFSERSYSEKHLIVVNGRPCPKLSNLKSVHKDTKKEYTRQFKESQYSLYPWLAGCENKVRLYCWPCLLFTHVTTAWSTTGVENLNSLQTLQKHHQQSVPHLQCLLKLASFGENRVDQALCNQLKMLNDQHNVQVKRNHEVLKRLIDVTCFLANQNLAFRDHEESASSSNQGNYVGLLNLLKRNDPILTVHFQTDTVFKGTSTAFQNELIQAVGKVLDYHIYTQLEHSEFVAIMLDEISDVDLGSQLSVVFRYCLKGEIYETFVGFIDVSRVCTADELFELVKSILQKYDVVAKLVAQTYDGAAVTSGPVHALQSKVRDLCPKALFVHCYAHNLYLVLSQGLNNIKECKIFFSTLNGMATFTSECCKRTNGLNLKGEVSSLVTTGWCFSSRLINEVQTYRDSIVEYFDRIQSDASSWEVHDRMNASGYTKFLESFETIFLLNVFSQLFDSDVLFNTLQNENAEILFIVNQINKFDGFLKAQRESFSEIWHRTLQTVLADHVQSHNIGKDQFDPNEAKYKKTYHEIVDNLIMQISDRFSSFEKLKYFDVLNGSKFKEYSRKYRFPEETLEYCTKDSHRDIFEHGQLKNELKVIYTNSESIVRYITAASVADEAATTNTRNLTPYDVLRYVQRKNLTESFEQVYRLSKLICTIPATPVSVEGSLSAVKRIKTYLSSAQGRDRQSLLPLLSIEKAMLMELRNCDDFVDRVIEHLSEEQRAHFMYK